MRVRRNQHAKEFSEALILVLKAKSRSLFFALFGIQLANKLDSFNKQRLTSHDTQHNLRIESSLRTLLGQEVTVSLARQ